MELTPLFDWAAGFYAQYPIFCYVAGASLLLLTLWKPAKMLKNAFLLLVLLAVLYLAMQLLGSMNVGIQAKDKAAKRTEEALK